MGNKRRLSINLSFLSPNNAQTQIQTPQINNKRFGVVGLGIVAALDQTHDPYLSNRASILAVSPKSTPIPIFGSSNSENMELSEDYTCVISHVGNNLIKKREYFDWNLTSKSETTVAAEPTSSWVTSGVFSASSPPAGESVAKDVFGTEDFLSSCCLCKKKLHGLDIFMYRGEKAFCSVECRCKQILSDEHKEKCSSAVKKPHEYSVSPCSGPMQFLAGVAAA